MLLFQIFKMLSEQIDQSLVLKLIILEFAKSGIC